MDRAGCPPGGRCTRLRPHAEAVGLDSLWGLRPFPFRLGGQAAEAIHEGWTIVAALAASTSTIELGQLVMCVSFRSPALLAKMAVTADGVSGGRPVLGLGAGWYARQVVGQRLADMRAALQAETATRPRCAAL